VLELGGSDPFIVFDDANLDEAINGATYGRFFGAGQICVSAKRMFVQSTVFKEFTGRFAEKAASLKVGNGIDPSTDIGPLVSKGQRSYVAKAVREAVSHGASVECGASAPKDLRKGFFYLPTVLTNVKMSMKVMSEEMFGPVAPVLPFRDEAQAIQLANSTRYGLGASIWTRDEEKALRVSRNIESGIVWINDVAVTFPHAPWGGVKDSGMGRHSSRYGLLDMVNIRQICINKIREPTRMWWLPYGKS
jgi:acyl-CoA reductase-like NAD-dependent aldehyde dehydrogenase